MGEERPDEDDETSVATDDVSPLSSLSTPPPPPPPLAVPLLAMLALVEVPLELLALF